MIRRAEMLHAESQAPESGMTALSVGDLAIDMPRRAVTRAGQPVELKPKEFDLLAFLAAQEKSYAASQKSDSRELALADFCQVLFGLNEFIYVE